jgi:phospholipid/cholesterol/gamma-HCH transport system permease protein
MKPAKPLPSYQCTVSECEGGGIILHLEGRMDVTNAASIMSELDSLLHDRPFSSLTVDLEGVTYLDDFGSLALVELKQLMASRNGQFLLINAHGKTSEALSIFKLHPLEKPFSLTIKRPPGILVHLGEATIKTASDLK